MFPDTVDLTLAEIQLAFQSRCRAGTTAALDQLNKYLMINEMPVVSSCYWPMVHGAKAEDVLKDEEGVAIMQTLGRNMAWLLRAIEAGKAASVSSEWTSRSSPACGFRLDGTPVIGRPPVDSIRSYRAFVSCGVMLMISRIVS